MNLRTQLDSVFVNTSKIKKEWDLTKWGLFHGREAIKEFDGG